MKTLNRPMFRYGGPIKEGVMNGIREPKKDGGSMTQRVQPSNDGSRPGYAGPLAALAYAPMAIGAATRFVAPMFGKFAQRQLPKLIRSGKNKGSPMLNKKGESIFRTGKGPKNREEFFEPNAVGRFFKNDPLAKAAVTGAGFTGKALTKVGGGIKYATTTPSGLTFLGLPVVYSAGKYFVNGKELNDDGIKNIKDTGKRGTSGAPGGGDPDMKYTAPEKELTPAEREQIEADARMKKMDKYKEIMDIKGMNKDAAYKSLIDASKIIQEGGNLKEQLKSGSLITKITAAASKRFDKVGDTEAALRSLVAKGEIENEMNKETKALDKEYKQSALDINKKKLAGSTLGEELSAYRTKNNKNASGKTLAGFVMDEGGSIVSIADSSAVDKHIKSGGDSVSFMELVVANNVKAGKEIIPGMYVVKDSLITINPDGSVTPNYKIT